MRVFVTGATGFIGSAVVAELIANGHEVLGLARSDAAAESLKAAGAIPHRGSTEDVDSLRAGAAQADGAIHTAFFHAFSHASLGTRMRVVLGGSPRNVVSRFLAATLATDLGAINAIGGSLTGPDRPFVAAFGTMALAPGRLGTEDDEIDPRSVGGARGAAEQAMRDLAGRGVRTSVVRLPPVVHGDGDRGGFLPMMIAAARKHGVVSHVGDGGNRWPAVHRLDAARLFVQALEKGDAGSRHHAIAEEGVPVIDIATAIGRRLDLPTRSATPGEIKAGYGFLAPFIGTDNPTSGAVTKARLGWEPTHRSLLDDLRDGTYFTG
ncbi:SDR family oxidoreductase [Umezawaea sp. Da 62-37]|uniref:SDR family oxidoreductase n=1 Tax=Umezawaea sp. Da 62-37 TaxID=3075927 RepID=UPI0028F72DBA|nr:SDR family oxidoreductase [Umezawaea sp. Da 62-37]WNV86084.1 SDR family oxidoreductase [Umezawaea sp. Da 62-37]